jgi:hypothetical protein
MSKQLSLACALVATLGACGGAAMTPAVRADIASRMQAAQTPIASCYQRALTTNRKLRGMMIFTFAAAAKSGQFADIMMVRDEIQDPALRFCVIGEIAKLKLEKPLDARLVVESYPMRFEWANP